jgi:hypothetical protein
MGNLKSEITAKADFEPASNRPDRNHVTRIIGQDAAIITDSAKGFEGTLDLFIQLVAISNHTDAANNDLTAEISSTLNGVVASMVRFKLLKGFFLPGNIRNQVTSPVGFFDGLKQQSSLVDRRQEFYFQGKFHRTKILNYLVQEKFKNTKTNGRSHSSHSRLPAMVGFPAQIL